MSMSRGVVPLGTVKEASQAGVNTNGVIQDPYISRS